MTCSGSTTEHILRGGQLFLGPQLDALGTATKLVTITSGGNDVGYTGDLMARSGAMGRLGKWWHGVVRPAASRPYGRVTETLEKIVAEIRKRAPHAEILIINYPSILPTEGTCAGLGITAGQAQISREVARRLADATRLAADRAGVTLVDMAEHSARNHACSDKPWVYGQSGKGTPPGEGAAFHPNAEGAAATADRIASTLRGSGLFY
jgi:lysophospholipase L1-like esterase